MAFSGSADASIEISLQREKSKRVKRREQTRNRT